MMKKILPLLFALFLPIAAQAKIYILLEEASERKFPIAVPEFVTVKGKHSSLTGEITELFRNDLDIAGIFKVLDETSFLGGDTDVETINFTKWTSIEAFALVKGIVEEKGGKLLLEMRLYDTQTRQLLVGKQYTVGKKDFPVAIHRFMDELMKALTGSLGPFNSEITAACGKQGARQIFITGIDATRQRYVAKIKGNSISPNWAPDGGSIAFTSFQSRFPEIYTVNSSGGGLKQLTHNKATNITPAFSPGGDSIAYASSVSGDTELYLMNRSGKTIRRITNVLNIDLSPSWSPDGSRLVFASERAGNLHLFVTGANGGGNARLTYTGYQNDQPDWSPDGSKIVFTARDRGAFDVFMMNSDGSLIQRLTRDEGNNESPTWSPDSRYISFSSARAGASGIYVMLDDGNNQTLIPNTGGCINPDWGPRLK
ncbi:MAG: PD40 domain-containing protein [Deltaproteobacteria bacterium]|nr:PD40 domain-containing protein [Deltaproteobacteria bacterium]